MKKLIIEGKKELSGTLKIGGAKNSVVALILLEQSERDASYRDVLNRFTEVYKNEGGVF